MIALLRFEDVTLRRGGRLLFEGLNFSLEPGEALHVSGPNGSGKSSLIRLGAGLLDAEQGRVERAVAALADDNLALDRELPLGRALAFWSRQGKGRWTRSAWPISPRCLYAFCRQAKEARDARSRHRVGRTAMAAG